MEAPQEIITTIAKRYRLKEGSVGPPTYYFGAQIRKHTLSENPSRQIWTLSTEKYVKEAICNVEVDLS